ncbi:phytanoyl-CoA dioxygenase family protein [Georgenia faecalis]|uniref:Phytanoyl-CoA dioxygenase family protein n=1 Tax=Georgenia faecalis TaxID=2483799 RepID=A0ABV9D7K6_9MICO|nr:phytanoyl-CoA dioxygenase family protein [Georgenia faecalis]
MTSPLSTDQMTAPALAEAVYRDGLALLPNAFPREWAGRLDDDLAREFIAALRSPGGVAPRGWNRFYFEPFAERVPAFLDVVTHPVIAALSAHLFGPDWQVVELGCDIPLPGAINQPWHRDFPMPEITRRERRLTSIAVNITALDVVDAPFQAVPGTQLDDGEDFEDAMFPPGERVPDLEGRMRSFHARMGNLSVRSGLIVHRGSAMGIGSRMRQVAIVGIVAPDDPAVVERRADPYDPHPPRIRMSQEYADSVPPHVLDHISVEVVAPTAAALPPYRTEHLFEGLRMSALQA